MKLLLDEMYPSLIARELRARGHDVVSVHESPGSGTSDERVLDYARSEGRAVLTENVRDFRPLADALLVAGESHAGLVLTTDKRWPRTARFAAETLEAGQAGARQHVRAGDAVRVAIAHDGYLTVEGERTDAILVEAQERGQSSSVVFAQRYRRGGRFKRFATIGNAAFVDSGESLL